MHFEFLVEDASGKKFVEEIVPKIVDTNSNTYVVHSYKGIGRIPPHLNEGAHPKHRFLLSQLPKLLNGLGKTFAGYGQDFEACVVVVCDLDTKDFAQFRGELNSVLENCHTPPTTRFCVAIEEGEAWLLGDLVAVKTAYPQAKDAVLNAYVPDSICGTWETLADAIHPGGRSALARQNNYHETGSAKFEWAKNIAQHIDPARNSSPSFQHFHRKVSGLAD